MAPLYTSNSCSSARPASLLAAICTPSSANAAFTSRNELPISFLWWMSARDAPITPPRTVSFNRFRRALVRKICSFSSLTFFSSPRSRTVYAPWSPPPPVPVAPAASAGGAPAGAGAPAAGAAAAGASAGGAAPAAGAPAAAVAGGASAAFACVASKVDTINISSPQRKVPIPSDVMSLLRQGERTHQQRSYGVRRGHESKQRFYQAAQVWSIPSPFLFFPGSRRRQKVKSKRFAVAEPARL